MDAIERLAAAEEIRTVKGRYCRAIDEKNLELLRSVFAEDATADYSESRSAPNVRGAEQGAERGGAFGQPLRGADEIARTIIAGVADMVTVHHCALGEIHVESADVARAVWPMVDRLLLPPGGPETEIIGYGFYRETYARQADGWKIKSIKLTRTRVDVLTS